MLTFWGWLRRWWRVQTRCKRRRHTESPTPYPTSVFIWFICEDCGKHIRYERR